MSRSKQIKFAKHIHCLTEKLIVYTMKFSTNRINPNEKHYIVFVFKLLYTEMKKVFLW